MTTPPPPSSSGGPESGSGEGGGGGEGGRGGRRGRGGRGGPPVFLPPLPDEKVANALPYVAERRAAIAAAAGDNDDADADARLKNPPPPRLDRNPDPVPDPAPPLPAYQQLLHHTHHPEAFSGRYPTTKDPKLQIVTTWPQPLPPTQPTNAPRRPLADHPSTTTTTTTHPTHQEYSFPPAQSPKADGDLSYPLPLTPRYQSKSTDHTAIAAVWIAIAALFGAAATGVVVWRSRSGGRAGLSSVSLSNATSATAGPSHPPSSLSSSHFLSPSTASTSNTTASSPIAATSSSPPPSPAPSPSDPTFTTSSLAPATATTTTIVQTTTTAPALAPADLITPPPPAAAPTTLDNMALPAVVVVAPTGPITFQLLVNSTLCVTKKPTLNETRQANCDVPAPAAQLFTGRAGSGESGAWVHVASGMCLAVTDSLGTSNYQPCAAPSAPDPAQTLALVGRTVVDGRGYCMRPPPVSNVLVVQTVGCGVFDLIPFG
ncbi:hypothetical protein DFJ73DRAFT_913905 [Zopfochytrium polystomum]|nr:hypothetical protein DFJ73DRAFT_913905 [Zopfochytrium polystomum]